MRKGVKVLAVVGASGSGKSSLVAAGLLPRLRAGAVEGSSAWLQIPRFTPTDQGDNPFRALAVALSNGLGNSAPLIDDIVKRLPGEPDWLAKIAETGLKHRPPQARMILFADQFEELFTTRVAEAHKASFIALIEAIGRASNILLVLSLRHDYYPHCTEFPGFAALLRDGSFPLAAPDETALTQMIEGPAKAAGLQIEAGLVAAIARDAGDNPGRLALVEHALETLYLYREGSSLLTVAAYRKLNGIAGLIQKQGDRAAEGSDAGILNELFDALSEVDSEGGAVRRRSYRDPLSPGADALAQRLLDARLLTSDLDKNTGKAWLEVAHEAVLRAWPLFHDWLKQNQSLKLWRQDVEQARQRWESKQRNPAKLLTGDPLKEALLKRKDRSARLSPAQQQFISLSRRRSVVRQVQSSALALLLPLMVGLYFSTIQSLDLTHRVAYDWALLSLGLKGPPEPKMVRIDCSKPCTFKMGGGDDIREVAIDRPYAIGVYEVTFDEYEVFRLAMNKKNSRCPDGHELRERSEQDNGYGRGRRPIINVSYDDAKCYAAWLSEETGQHYRLPSEAEWDYAARAGSTTEFFWGNDEKAAGDYAWFFVNSDSRTHEVGLKNYNAWGLYDTAGNVYEWVEDCWEARPASVPEFGHITAPDLSNKCANDRRVIRGGSWSYKPSVLRSALRNWDTPDFRSSNLGFRLAQDIE